MPYARKEDYRASQRKYALHYRTTRKAAGICQRCGRAPRVDGNVHCCSCRAIVAERTRAYFLRVKLEAYEAYGGARCRCCGETHLAFLTLDHIDSNGAQHRREVNGDDSRRAANRSMYVWLKKHGYPSGFQVLCANCNVGRHRNKGVCPHQHVNL